LKGKWGKGPGPLDFRLDHGARGGTVVYVGKMVKAGAMIRISSGTKEIGKSRAELIGRGRESNVTGGPKVDAEKMIATWLGNTHGRRWGKQKENREE